MASRVHVDRSLVAQWCAGVLGAPPAVWLFETGYLSLVLGVGLADGRDVVVKVRPWQDRLLACSAVQQALFDAGYPAPRPLAGPSRVGPWAVSAEELVTGGGPRPAGPGAAACFAEALAGLVRSAPAADDVGDLAPTPPWADWGGDRREALWPAPDDRRADLNGGPATWLDDLGARVRETLRRDPGRPVIGHVDWYSPNIAWHDQTLLAVYDWDSVAALPEAAIAGLAAAVWPAAGRPGEEASVEQSEEFLGAYADRRGRPWADAEITTAWLAGLWLRAFDAKKALAIGRDPAVTLTEEEAGERLHRSRTAR